MAGAEQTDEAQRFTALFLQYRIPVHDFARRRLGSDAAQEVVAETFLVAWRRLDDVPPHALPWLYQVATYEIATLRRRLLKLANLERALLRDPVTVGERHDPGPARVLAQAVGAAFRSLGPRDQEILRLAAWEQLSSADGAAVLGCSVSAYRMRLHRARVLLARRSGAEELLGSRRSGRRERPAPPPFPQLFLALSHQSMNGGEEV
jgi:RNA polymerase sigma-70 factor (ECF subfamily)